MKSTFRATAILSGGSVTSILLSLISAKVMAVYLHPAGYGYYGLLQSFLGLMVLLSGMGIGTGLVRAGAGPASRNDEAAIASLRRGAWLLFAATGSVVTLVVFFFRAGLSEWALGNRDSGWTVVVMCAALLFMVAANIQVGILNAYHRVTALAKYGVINTLAN
ncbi:MAG: oligosaccharide flippase family protein, partial [Candidatus Acidiferrales bacterium]